MNPKIQFRPSVSSASGHCKGWVKHVTDVDPNGKNGYAFSGQFLPPGKLTELPAGALLLHVDPTGSVKNGGKAAYLAALNSDATETDETSLP